MVMVWGVVCIGRVLVSEPGRPAEPGLLQHRKRDVCVWWGMRWMGRWVLCWHMPRGKEGFRDIQFSLG